MPRDGSGGYSLPANNFSVAASGNTATDTDANAVWADIVAAIAQSVSKDGQTTMTGALKMGGQKITGLAVGTVNTDGLTLGQAQNGAFRWGGVAGGTADALTLSLSPAVTAYVDGMTILFVSGASPNTGAATANVNAVGADAILKNGAALQANDIQASKVYAITSYNSDWHLWSPSPQSFSSTDAGATEGPTLDLYRDSPSPAANDVAGAVNFYGEDSAGNKELYAKISNVIDDPTSTSEDGSIRLSTVVAGAITEQARWPVPAFLAHKNGTDQTGVANNTTTALTFGTESFDIGGFFASNAWTPPAGVVEMVAQVFLSAGVTDQTAYTLHIQKDGVTIAQHVVRGSGANSISLNVSVIDIADGTDAYSAAIQSAEATNKTVLGTATATFFFGRRI